MWEGEYILDITYLLLVALFVLGACFAYRKVQRKKKREDLIDKCLEKYANEDKHDKND